MERTPDKFARLVTYVVIAIALGAMCLGVMSCHVHYHISIDGQNPYTNRPSFNLGMITKPIHDTSKVYNLDTVSLGELMLLSECDTTWVGYDHIAIWQGWPAKDGAYGIYIDSLKMRNIPYEPLPTFK